MEKQQLFQSFLESIKTDDNQGIVESVQSAFGTIFESEDTPNEWEIFNSEVGSGYFEVDFGNIKGDVLSFVNTPEIQSKVKAVYDGYAKELAAKYGELTEEDHEELKNSTIGYSYRVECDVDGEFSGGYYSASSTGPAEYPEWEGEYSISSAYLVVTLDYDPIGEIDVSENTEAVKELDGVVDTVINMKPTSKYGRTLWSAIEDSVYNSDDYPSAPKNFRSYYSGPN